MRHIYAIVPDLNPKSCGKTLASIYHTMVSMTLLCPLEDDVCDVLEVVEPFIEVELAAQRIYVPSSCD